MKKVENALPAMSLVANVIRSRYKNLGDKSGHGTTANGVTSVILNTLLESKDMD